MESGPISDVAEQDEPKEKRDAQGDVGHPSHFSGQVSLARSADQHLLTVEAGAVQPARGPDTLVVFCASQVAKTGRNPWGIPESGCHCVRLLALDIIDDGAVFLASGGTRMVMALRLNGGKAGLAPGSQPARSRICQNRASAVWQQDRRN